MTNFNEGDKVIITTDYYKGIDKEAIVNKVKPLTNQYSYELICTYSYSKTCRPLVFGEGEFVLAISEKIRRVLNEI